jgi:hypothetical protein
VLWCLDAILKTGNKNKCQQPRINVFLLLQFLILHLPVGYIRVFKHKFKKLFLFFLFAIDMIWILLVSHDFYFSMGGTGKSIIYLIISHCLYAATSYLCNSIFTPIFQVYPANFFKTEHFVYFFWVIPRRLNFVPTFRNTMFHLNWFFTRHMKMEHVVCSETSAHKIQTPVNHS